jgi:hypothetical protein
MGSTRREALDAAVTALLRRPLEWAGRSSARGVLAMQALSCGRDAVGEGVGCQHPSSAHASLLSKGELAGQRLTRNLTL